MLIASNVFLYVLTYIGLELPAPQLQAFYSFFWPGAIVGSLLFMCVAFILPHARAKTPRLDFALQSILITGGIFAVVNAFVLSSPSAVRFKEQRWEVAYGRFGSFEPVDPQEAAQRLRENIRWVAGGLLAFQLFGTALLLRTAVALHGSATPERASAESA